MRVGLGGDVVPFGVLLALRRADHEVGRGLGLSGAVFIGLTFLVAAWARRVRDQFAPQDDLVDGDQLVAGDVGA